MKVICTTTIHPPTEALRLFADMRDWTLVVAGDQKTPHEIYRDLRCVYLHPNDQLAYDRNLSDAIGWNCIQRRNFAFLHAVKELKAEVIATVDDDNLPLLGWGENLLLGRRCIPEWQCGQVAFDPVSVTNHKQLWHRGFPLNLVAHRSSEKVYDTVGTFDIQADFWNGDPDIDAICRFLNPEPVTFSDHGFPFCANKLSPFNSQNTFLTKEVMPHYFCFPGIGRFDDIWAAYHAQAMGFRVAYGKASVIQRRNAHNLIADLKQEYFGYEHTQSLVESLQTNKNAVLDRLPPQALTAFLLYQKHYE